MKKNRENIRIEKYSKKPLYSFSNVRPYFDLLLRPRTFTTAWKFIFTVIKDFFFLQEFQHFHLTKRPVIYVDTKLDDKIPFVPEKVKIYMGFISFFVTPIDFLIHRFGYRKASEYINIYLSFLTKLYTNASSIYKYCMTTTHRPDYKENIYFKTIHSADPHLLCVPSLHVSIAAGVYAWFNQVFKTGFLPQEEADLRIKEIRTRAIEIIENVLFVKQHSVNCIPTAFYMLSVTLNKSFFTPEDAISFINDLFADSKEIPEETKKEIREYFIYMYERAFLENNFSEKWQDSIYHWLEDFAEKTNQSLNLKP